MDLIVATAPTAAVGDAEAVLATLPIKGRFLRQKTSAAWRRKKAFVLQAALVPLVGLCWSSPGGFVLVMLQPSNHKN